MASISFRLLTRYQIVVICLLACLSIASALAQPKKVDSLQTLLAKHPQADTFRVNRLFELADAFNAPSGAQYIPTDSIFKQSLALAKRLQYAYGQIRALLSMSELNMFDKQGEQYAAEGLRLAKYLGDKALLVEALLTLGRAYMYSQQAGDNKRALSYFQEAFTVARASGQPVLIASAMDLLGSYYFRQLQYEQALSWSFQWLHVAQKTNLSKEERQAYQLIGYIYFSLTDYEQALKYYKNALAKVNSADKLSKILVLRSIGDCFRLTKRYPQAIATYQQGLKLLQQNISAFKAQTNFYQSSLEGALADTYERAHNPSALSYAQLVLRETNRRNVNPIITGYISTTIGRYYVRANQPDSAVWYGRQAFELALQNQQKTPLMEASYVLSHAYQQKEDYTNAYAYLNRYLGLKDSLNNDELNRKATAARFNDQMSYQQSQIIVLTKDKQLQYQAARRHRLILTASLTVLILSIGLALVLYRNNRNKQRANALLQSQQNKLNQAFSELKATQDQLIQKEKMASLGELTAGIAHEIQNPLNFVNNFSEVSTELVNEFREGPLQQLPNADKEYAEEILADLAQNLHKIHHHGKRAANIVKGMLEHSRAAPGHKEPTDLNALAEEYLKLAYHGLRAKDKDFNAELLTHFDKTLGLIEVTPQDLGRVLLNLYNNAFYSVQEKQKTAPVQYKPTITVSTVRTKQEIEIRVSDNGTGMPDSIRQKIFQPFFTTKPTGKGTGLGLSISYDIVTKGHAGSLTVHSQEGEGTEFVIQLMITKAN